MALYIPLFVMSALQIGVSNVATELAYINPSITLICTVVAAFLNLLLSNVAFSLFAVDRSKETVQPARTLRFISWPRRFPSRFLGRC